MFPLYDENPSVRTPWVTIALIALNLMAWVGLQGFGAQRDLAESVCRFGLIPAALLGDLPAGVPITVGSQYLCMPPLDTAWLTPLTSMFMHGSWLHIVGNLWFLWVFGDNVEDAMGAKRFLAFYLLGGLAAAAAQTSTDPGSAVPMVGASGAIGAVMGGYAVLYPKARVQMLVVLGFLITRIGVPAVFMLGYWFFLQLLGGLPSLSGGEAGVAFWAHVGGFIAGLVLAPLLARKGYVQQHLEQPRRQTRQWF